LLGIYALSEWRLDKTYEVGEVTVSLSGAPGDVARGEHLVRSVTVCVDCHAEDLGGETIQGIPLLARVNGPNLTPGEGGIAELTDRDLLLAIRHALRPDLTPLIVMPAHSYRWMSEIDLAAVVAYLRQLSPIDRDRDQGRPGAMVRAPLILGMFKLLPAAEIDHDQTIPPATAPGVTSEYGSYLVAISGCKDCHGDELKGGRVPGSIRGGPDLSAGGAAGRWSADEFATIMREGATPEGNTINSVMPWRYYKGMTDEELQAIYAYLQSLLE
jgi:mono/diheme cytochrome c family protein